MTIANKIFTFNSALLDEFSISRIFSYQIIFLSATRKLFWIFSSNIVLDSSQNTLVRAIRYNLIFASISSLTGSHLKKSLIRIPIELSLIYFYSKSSMNYIENRKKSTRNTSKLHYIPIKNTPKIMRVFSCFTFL